MGQGESDGQGETTPFLRREVSGLRFIAMLFQLALGVAGVWIAGASTYAPASTAMHEIHAQIGLVGGLGLFALAGIWWGVSRR